MSSASSGSGPVVDEALRPRTPELPEDIETAYPRLRPVGGRIPLTNYVRDLWDRREFIMTLPLGELRAQNQDSMLGQFWHLLNPLLSTAVYYLVFGVILNAQRGVDNYPAFLIIGVLVFDYTRSSVSSGTRIIVKNRNLIQSINFPRAVLPIGAIIEETLAFMPGAVVMLAVALITGESLALTWILILPLMVVQGVFNLGLAMIAARLTFHFRDFQQLVPYLMRLWFYSSGVLFALESEVIQSRIGTGLLYDLLRLNPAHTFVAAARGALLDGQFVSSMWAGALVWAVFVFVAGFMFFRAAENEYGRV